MSDCGQGLLSEVAGLAAIISDKRPDWLKSLNDQGIDRDFITALLLGGPSGYGPRGLLRPQNFFPKSPPAPPKKPPLIERKPPFPRRDPPSPSARKVPQAKNNAVSLNRAKLNSSLDSARGIGTQNTQASIGGNRINLKIRSATPTIERDIVVRPKIQPVIRPDEQKIIPSPRVNPKPGKNLPSTPLPRKPNTPSTTPQSPTPVEPSPTPKSPPSVPLRSPITPPAPKPLSPGVVPFILPKSPSPIVPTPKPITPTITPTETPKTPTVPTPTQPITPPAPKPLPPGVVPFTRPQSPPTVTPPQTPSSPSPQPTVTPATTPTRPAPSTQPITPTAPQPSPIPISPPAIAPNPTPATVPKIAPSTNPVSPPAIPPSSIPKSPPTVTPAQTPTTTPTKNPSSTPKSPPTVTPAQTPRTTPTKNPSSTPTSPPTVTPAQTPTTTPTKNPSSTPTSPPTVTPAQTPTTIPTKNLSPAPTTTPAPSKEYEDLRKQLTALGIIIAGIAANTEFQNLKNAAKTGSCESLQSPSCTTGLEDRIKNPLFGKLDAAQVARDINAAGQSSALAAILLFLKTNFAKLFGFLDNQWVDRALGVVNLGLGIHNGMMLSNALGKTAAAIIDNVAKLPFFPAFVDSTGASIPASRVFGNNLETFFIQMVGLETYTNWQEGTAVFNMISKSAINLLNRTESLMAKSAKVQQKLGVDVGDLSNAMLVNGLISPSSYPKKAATKAANQAMDSETESELASTYQGVAGSLKNLKTITGEVLTITRNAQRISTEFNKITALFNAESTVRKNLRKRISDKAKKRTIYTIVDIKQIKINANKRTNSNPFR